MGWKPTGFLQWPLPEAVLRFPSPLLWLTVTLSPARRSLPAACSAWEAPPVTRDLRETSSLTQPGRVDFFFFF